VHEKEGEWFEGWICSALNWEAQRHGWDPVVARSRILQSLLLVCAVPERHYGERLPPMKLTGWWVMEGIKKYLRAPADTPFERKEGLIVGHRNGHREFLSMRPDWDEAFSLPELAKYEEVHQSGGLTSWAPRHPKPWNDWNMCHP